MPDPLPRACIPVSQYNPQLHNIISGPYDGPYAATDCANSCGTTTSTTTTPPCCPQELWSGNGTFNITSSCPNEPTSSLFIYNPATCEYVATKTLSDGIHIIRLTASCDPNGVGCSKWSGSAFTDCPDGSISLGSIVTQCEDTPEPTGPPVWQIIFNPGACGCPTITTTTTTMPPVSCVNNSDCRYCETNFFAPRDYGYFTVTGAGSVIFSNPNDPQDPLNGTYDINGTYTYWFSSGPGIDTYVHTGHNNGIGFAIGSPTDTNSSVDISILLGYYGGSVGSEFGIWRWDNSTRTPSFALGECIPYTLTGYTVDTTLPSELTINNPAPTVTYDIYGTDKTTCDAAGGVYSTYNPAWGELVSYCTVFNIIPQGEDPETYSCPQAPHIGGNYYLYSDPTNPPYVQKPAGYCCDSICVPPWIYNPSNTDCIKYGCP
jgi:hypothetical protein